MSALEPEGSLMELELTPDQEMFVETTDKFLNDCCTPADLRAMRDDPDGFDRDYWRQGAELGWTSLLVSEEDGGGTVSGRGVADLALVAFELGRHAAPGPFLPTNVVAAALSAGGTDEQKATVLPGIVAGEVVATWCWSEPRPHDRLGDVSLIATERNGSYVLDGRKQPVEAGAQADQFLVTARTEDGGLVQLLVPASTAGVTVAPMHGLDLTRRFAEVRFDSATVPASAVVGDPAGSADDVERQLQLAIVIQLAEMVGAMDRSFAITMEWLFDRYSFGRPLASYQELKHRCADMKAWLEAGHAIADTCAQHVQDASPRAAEMASVGKAYLGQYGPELVHDCIQMHGGIGVTFDHDLHLYLRRVVLGSRLYGTVSEHRQRLTALLERGATDDA